MQNIAPERRLILALDTPDRESAIDLVRRTRSAISCYKVGLELFSAQGPSFLQWLRRENVDVFLDLKLHDIPNTVKGAVAQAARLGVRFLTVHALGGSEMLRAAQMARSEQTVLPGVEATRLLAVTVLTHHSPQSLAELGLPSNPEQVAERLVTLARTSGIDGCVCSPQEIATIRAAMGEDFLIVTPGVRPAGSPAGDQTRIATPFEAIRDGADYLVVGRPIRTAAEPEKVAHAIVDEIRAGLEARG